MSVFFLKRQTRCVYIYVSSECLKCLQIEQRICEYTIGQLLPSRIIDFSFVAVYEYFPLFATFVIVNI